MHAEIIVYTVLVANVSALTILAAYIRSQTQAMLSLVRVVDALGQGISLCAANRRAAEKSKWLERRKKVAENLINGS